MAEDKIIVLYKLQADTSDVRKNLTNLNTLSTEAQKKRVSSSEKATKEINQNRITEASKAANTITKTFGNSFQKLSGLAGKIGLAIGFGAIVAGAKRVVNSLITMQAEARRAETVFGSSLGLVEKSANDLSKAIGLSRREFIAAAGGVGDLLVPMGFTRKEAASLSTEILELSGALKQWNGDQRDVSDIARIVSKAFLGERDGLVELGVKISEADIQQKLLTKGQKALTGAALEQAKAIATQELLFAKSADAMTAFREGQDGVVGVVNELTSDLKTVGEGLLKLIAVVLYPIVKVLSLVVRGIRAVVEWFSELKGSTQIMIAVGTAIGTAMTLALGPIGLLIGAIGALIVGFAALNESIPSFEKGVEEGKELAATYDDIDASLKKLNKENEKTIGYQQELAKQKDRILEANKGLIQQQDIENLNLEETIKLNKKLREEKINLITTNLVAIQQQINAAKEAEKERSAGRKLLDFALEAANIRGLSTRDQIAFAEKIRDQQAGLVKALLDVNTKLKDNNKEQNKGSAAVIKNAAKLNDFLDKSIDKQIDADRKAFEVFTSNLKRLVDKGKISLETFIALSAQAETELNNRVAKTLEDRTNTVNEYLQDELAKKQIAIDKELERVKQAEKERLAAANEALEQRAIAEGLTGEQIEAERTKLFEDSQNRIDKYESEANERRGKAQLESYKKTLGKIEDLSKVAADAIAGDFGQAFQGLANSLDQLIPGIGTAASLFGGIQDTILKTLDDSKELKEQEKERAEIQKQLEDRIKSELALKQQLFEIERQRNLLLEKETELTLRVLELSAQREINAKTAELALAQSTEERAIIENQIAAIETGRDKKKKDILATEQQTIAVRIGLTPGASPEQISENILRLSEQRLNNEAAIAALQDISFSGFESTTAEQRLRRLQGYNSALSGISGSLSAPVQAAVNFARDKVTSLISKTQAFVQLIKKRPEFARESTESIALSRFTKLASEGSADFIRKLGTAQAEQAGIESQTEDLEKMVSILENIESLNSALVDSNEQILESNEEIRDATVELPPDREQSVLDLGADVFRSLGTQVQLIRPEDLVSDEVRQLSLATEATRALEDRIVIAGEQTAENTGEMVELLERLLSAFETNSGADFIQMFINASDSIQSGRIS